MTGPNDNRRAPSASRSKARTKTSKMIAGCVMGLVVVCSIVLVAVLYQVQAASTTRDGPEIKKQVPVIGILTEVLRDYKRFAEQRHLHIASSYVKWMESAGAQVVPVLLNQDERYYEQVFRQTNGLLFPGGDNLLDPTKRTPMMVAAEKLYRLAVEANDRGDFYPIWGTCLGLELLSVLSGRQNVLDSCEAHDVALPVEFVERGKLFAPSKYANLDTLGQDYSKVIMDTLARENITYNFHRKCLTDAGLARAGLGAFYRPLAYSRDKNNLKFIAIMEAVKYPFFGVQFHPEKPPFEFVVKKSQVNIPHSRESIAVSRYFADFFVQQAQTSGHQASQEELNRELIYNHNATYTAPLRDMYEQRYLFAWNESQNEQQLTTEEFIDDHLVESDEEVSEEVSQAGKERPSSLVDNKNNNKDGDTTKTIELMVTNDDDSDIYLIVDNK